MSTHIKLSVLLYIFNLLDTAFTSLAVATMGVAVELNPVMRAVLVAGGIPAFVVAKIIIGFIAISILYSSREGRYALPALWVMTSMYALLMVWTLPQALVFL